MLLRILFKSSSASKQVNLNQLVRELLNVWLISVAHFTAISFPEHRNVGLIPTRWSV